MCFARTAALQGGFEKEKVNASKEFLQQFVHEVQKSFESYAGNMFCSRVRGMVRSLENIAKTVVLLHEEHFCDACLLTPKIIDKCGFEGSKTLPDCPKSSPERPQARKKRPT